MQCPKCGSDRTQSRGKYESGTPRMLCKDCKKSSPQVDHFAAPAGHSVKGVSTLHDAEGKVALQWVKTTVSESQREAAMRAAAEELAKPLKGTAKRVAAPKRNLRNSLSSYNIGDGHLGMYAWAAETGVDFDTDIAAKDLRAAIDHLVASAPASDTAYLMDLGDFTHADNRRNMTPESGNLLDVDSRFQRVIRIAVGVLRYGVLRLLEKHNKVEVFCVPGNHNPDSAGWMALLLAAHFESEPRVKVETSPSKFYYRQFGKSLIGITHGDKIKFQDLPSIMAADRPEEWGATKHRYWWCGHVHHTKHQEFRGCFVETFNTLAASDAWHHASGYRSARQMQRIDVDAEHGIYARGICNIGMIRP